LQVVWKAPDGSRIEVRPDLVWQGMYRVHAGGCISDMVNLARARDAAAGMAERGRARS